MLTVANSYVGEVTLWTAQFLTAYNAMSSPAIAGSLIPHWAAYAAAVSPIAEYLLIRFVSGVPLLEVRRPVQLHCASESSLRVGSNQQRRSLARTRTGRSTKSASSPLDSSMTAC